MIDLTYAKKKFEEYLKLYDIQDDKIRLKKVHTFAVLKTAEYICKKEKMSQEDTQLALFIALLHDIGRFEQLKKFKSFDDKKFDHAQFGIKVLFEDGKIREFTAETAYDTIIKTAIANHSAYQLPPGLTQKEKLHCRIIRDADKLDNFRVKDTEKIETLFDCSEETVGAEEISDHILEEIRKEHSILTSTRKTHMDQWVSYLAFIFDLNFSASFQFLEEHRWVDSNINKICYTNQKAKKKMEEIRAICNAYVKRHLPLELRRQWKAVIFDMDGLMFDTERVIQRSWQIVGEQMGYHNFGDHIYHTLGMNRKRRRQYFLETMGENFPYDTFLDTYRKVSEKYLKENGIPVKPGLLELLEFLKQKKIPIAVATSSSRKYAEQKLKEAGTFPYLDIVLCGDMVTRSKPDPEIYETACRLLGTIPEETIVLEDSENGLRAAIAAGTRAIMVPDLIKNLPQIEKRLEAKLESLNEVKIYMEHLQ